MQKLSITLLIMPLCFSTTSLAQKGDSIKQPEEKIEANKEFEEFGNLIWYNAFYGYSSSHSNKNAKTMDSVMTHFYQIENLST